MGAPKQQTKKKEKTVRELLGAVGWSILTTVIRILNAQTVSLGVSPVAEPTLP